MSASARRRRPSDAPIATRGRLTPSRRRGQTLAPRVRTVRGHPGAPPRMRPESRHGTACEGPGRQRARRRHRARARRTRRVAGARTRDQPAPHPGAHPARAARTVPAGVRRVVPGPMPASPARADRTRAGGDAAPAVAGRDPAAGRPNESPQHPTPGTGRRSRRSHGRSRQSPARSRVPATRT